MNWMWLATFVTVLASYDAQGQRTRVGPRVDAGIGVGYGLATGNRSRDCSNLDPGRNSSDLLCQSDIASVVYPSLRFGVDVSFAKRLGLFGMAGLEGLDRRSKNVFRSNRVDTLEFLRYVTRHPQVNGYIIIGKEFGKVGVGFGGSIVMFEAVQYFRWRSDGEKEEWLNSQRVQRGFRARPQLLLTYEPGHRVEGWRAFLVVDIREAYSAKRNVIDSRLGVVRSF